MARPRPPADTVRSAILLRAVVPEIGSGARRLRDDLEGLSQARREMAEKKTQLANITAALESEHKRLAVLFGQNTALKHRTLAERRTAARRLKSLAGEAATLRELLNRLNKSRRITPRPQRPEAERRPHPETGATAAGPPAGLTGAPGRACAAAKKPIRGART